MQRTKREWRLVNDLSEKIPIPMSNFGMECYENGQGVQFSERNHVMERTFS